MSEAIGNLIESLRVICEPIFGLRTVASASYIFGPFVMLMVMGIVCGILGVIVNLRCAEFNAEATIHSIFPGIVAGAVYGGIDQIVPYASVVAIFVAICLTFVSHHGMKGSSEAGTAVVLTSFFSLGIILSLMKGDMSGQLEALMFGRLLDVTDVRLLQAIIVCILALIVICLTWKEQVLYAFDPKAARAARMPVWLLDFALNVALAAVVVATSSAVGTLLVIGYLVVPGATGRLFAKNIRTMTLISVLCGMAGGYIGLLIMNMDTSHPISPQASVALSVILIYFACLLIYLVKNKVFRKRKPAAVPGHKPASTPELKQPSVPGHMQASTTEFKQVSALERKQASPPELRQTSVPAGGVAHV